MEKQIEEMAIVIANYDDSIVCELGDCKGCSYNNFGRKCIWLSQAEALYNAGYRKVEQGEWKVRGIQWKSCPINHSIKCSNCGFDIEMLQGRRYRYCPNCGAKMKGAE